MKAFVLVAALALAGCATPGGAPPSSLKPVCAALIGPIRYSSTNTASRRYAAALLAKDLKTRNAVGRRLGCPQYRR